MRGTPTIVRATGGADLAAVADLFRAYAASLSVDLAYQDFDGELAGLPGRYAPPSGTLLLAHNGARRPLGCVALRRLDETAAEMKRLYVAPAGRGLGLGRTLAEAAIGTARDLGYREVRLDTLPEMTAAQGLYLSLGFAETAPYYPSPVEGTRFMSLRL